MIHDLRRHATSFVVDDVLFRGIAWVGRNQPLADPARHGVTVECDVPYLPSGEREHLLDVYRPREPAGPMPVVLYVHGGGFRKLSKDTHWIMGLAFARRGFLVYNINYRLGPRSPFPCALEDCGAALRFVATDAPRRGGDLDRLVWAGESAGANLVTAMTVASCYRRHEACARRLFDLDLRPRVTAPACGLLQVSDPQRYDGYAQLTRDLVRHAADAYLRDPAARPDPERLLADPLLVLESGEQPHRPLPAFFAGVGTLDPLLDDTRRLGEALARLAVPHEVRTYPGGIHAFHAFVVQRRARRFWADQFAFVERALGATRDRSGGPGLRP